MPEQSRFRMVVGICLAAAALCGCDVKQVKSRGARRLAAPADYQPETVSTHATLLEGRDMAVRGHCVVYGLGSNGSPEVPAPLTYNLVRNFGICSCVCVAQEDGLLCDSKKSARVGPA